MDCFAPKNPASAEFFNQADRNINQNEQYEQ